MKLIRVELNKIEKSRIGRILSPLIVLAIIVYSFILMSGQNKISNVFIYVVGVFNNINLFGIIGFATIYCTALLFAKDFESRTIIYTRIKETSMKRIYFSRVVAIMIYILKIYVFSLVGLFIIGFIKYRASTLFGDTNIIQSFFRVILFVVQMWLSNLFFLCIGLLVSVILKNQILTIVISLVSSFVLNVVKGIIPATINKYVVMTYLEFYQNNLFTVNGFDMFIMNIVMAVLNYIVYSLILYYISNFIISMENRRC